MFYAIKETCKNIFFLWNFFSIILVIAMFIFIPTTTFSYFVAILSLINLYVIIKIFIDEIKKIK